MVDCPRPRPSLRSASIATCTAAAARDQSPAFRERQRGLAHAGNGLQRGPDDRAPPDPRAPNPAAFTALISSSSSKAQTGCRCRCSCAVLFVGKYKNTETCERSGRYCVCKKSKYLVAKCWTFAYEKDDKSYGGSTLHEVQSGCTWLDGQIECGNTLAYAITTQPPPRENN